MYSHNLILMSDLYLKIMLLDWQKKIFFVYKYFHEEKTWRLGSSKLIDKNLFFQIEKNILFPLVFFLLSHCGECFENNNYQIIGDHYYITKIGQILYDKQ